MRVILASVFLACACAGTPVADQPEAKPFGRCTYVNGFSKAPECRDYLGPDWDEGTAGDDCDDWSGTLEPGAACDLSAILGRCLVEAKAGSLRISFPGTDPASCGSTRSGCELFAGGTFYPEPVCAN
jgi:hypothetical protein